MLFSAAAPRYEPLTSDEEQVVRYALISDIQANLPALYAVLSHLSYEWTRDHVSPEMERFLGQLPFRIDRIHFLNTGSVGRPRDGDWRAGYVVLDMGGAGVEVEFIRVEYDVEEAMRGIRDSTLPDDFARYHRNGGASS